MTVLSRILAQLGIEGRSGQMPTAIVLSPARMADVELEAVVWPVRNSAILRVPGVPCDWYIDATLRDDEIALRFDGTQKRRP